MTGSTPTPSAELRTAAARLRELVTAIEAPDLPDQSWHTEACANEETGDCPCIVAQGTLSLEHGSVPVFYVADAETPECAAYIAAMHPGVGKALADWLDETATEVSAAEGTEYALHPSGGVFTSWEAALAVARSLTP